MEQYNALENFVQRYFDPNNNLRIELSPYSYRATFENLLNGTTQTKMVNVAANADFVFNAVRYRCVTAADGVIAEPLVDILLTDAGSQEQLMVESQPLNLIAGVPTLANDSALWPYPRIISGRSQLNVQASNVSDILSTPVDYDRLVIVFSGVLVRTF